MADTIEGRVSEVLIGCEPLLPTLAAKQASPDAAYVVSSRVTEVRVAFEGFAGDRHAGLTMRSTGRTPHYPRGTEIRNSRQVSLVAPDELAEVAAALGIPGIEPAWLGANLALAGIPRLSLLPPSTRLFFPGDAVLVIDAENEPCAFPGRVLQHRFPERRGLASAFPKAALHRRGLVSWVERPGLIREGDVVRVQLAPQIAYSR